MTISLDSSHVKNHFFFGPISGGGTPLGPLFLFFLLFFSRFLSVFLLFNFLIFSHFLFISSSFDFFNVFHFLFSFFLKKKFLLFFFLVFHTNIFFTGVSIRVELFPP